VLPQAAIRSSKSTEGYVVPAGPSIIEKIWAELDQAVIESIRLKKRADSLGEGEGWTEAIEEKGRCLGIAESLAIILNPYDPDVNEVRREAMRRYRNKGSTA
jgi:hypothetical protein